MNINLHEASLQEGGVSFAEHAHKANRSFSASLSEPHSIATAIVGGGVGSFPVRPHRCLILRFDTSAGST